MSSSSGERKTIHIAIGRPYAMSSKEAACPIEMAGLYPNIRDIRGADTLQALTLAVEFVKITIQKWEEKGFHFGPLEDSELPPGTSFQPNETGREQGG